MDALKETIRASVLSILPHKSQDEALEIVEFVVKKGVKKEADLRRMTISYLENICDSVDSTDLFEIWQAKYGVKQTNEPSTSTGRSTEPLRERNLVVVPTAQYTIPVFDKDSPHIPAAVRKAIEQRKRPKMSDRAIMASRIVDHLLETIPHFLRTDFPKVADQIVESYPDSFKDTILINEKGSDSLRRQFKNCYDNRNRNLDDPQTSKRKHSEAPQAYGCLNWNPPLPDGDSGANQLKVKDGLKKIMENTVRHWDWRRVKTMMEESFYLQRRNINGPSEQPSRRKRRPGVLDSDEEDDATEKAMTVPELLIEWPSLFKPKGMNHHFALLTGVDFFTQLDKFMADEGKILIDFLASKNTQHGRVRTEMTIQERRGNADAPLVALIRVLMMQFKEDASALATHVEATTEFEEVQTENLPEDNTPHLVIAGPTLYDITKIFLAIDRSMVNSCETFREAFSMLFCSYFVFNIQYSTALASTLSYVQKAIAGIQPRTGTKCQSANEQTKVNRRVTKLSNDFQPYYDSFNTQNQPTATAAAT